MGVPYQLVTAEENGSRRIMNLKKCSPHPFFKGEDILLKL